MSTKGIQVVLKLKLPKYLFGKVLMILVVKILNFIFMLKTKI